MLGLRLARLGQAIPLDEVGEPGFELGEAETVPDVDVRRRARPEPLPEALGDVGVLGGSPAAGSGSGAAGALPIVGSGPSPR